jgi:hypothetical protein
VAKIKNTVDIDVKERGSAKAAKGIEGVTKAQTRQTNAGVSASKQFSAQAQGLGGFVAAYAGAAANVFALQQAFAALQRATQFETVIKGTRALAAEMGASGDTILASVKEITKGQIAIEEAAQNVNIALSAGFNTKQIEALSEISLKASRALGRNLTDAMQRVVRGTAKLEPELLDEIGIFTRIDPAVERYASKLNVAASSLTQFERRQAFVNEVIDEGQKKFSAIDTSVGGNQASLERFIVQLQELAIGFGQLIATGLTPLLDFLSEGNRATLVFLGILTMVFGKLGSIVGASIAGMITKLQSFADKLADTAKLSKANLKDLSGAYGMAQSELGKSAQGRQVGFQPRIAGQSAEQQKKLSDTLAKQRANTLKTTSQLTKANATYSASIKNLSKNQAANGKRIAFLNTLIRQNKVALEGATMGARGMAAASLFLGRAVGFLSAAFAKLNIFLGVIFAVTTAFQLFGIDIIGKVTKFFSDLSQETEYLESTMKGLATVAEEGSAAFRKLAQRAGVSKKEFKELDKITDDLASNLKTTEQDLMMTLTLQSADSKRREISQIAQLNKVSRDTAAVIKTLNDELKGTDDTLKKLLLEQAIDNIKEFKDGFKALAPAAAEAGISMEQAIQAFRFLGEGTGGPAGVLKAFQIDVAGFDEETAGAVASFGNVARLAFKEFDAGTTSAEKLSKQLFGMQTRFDELRDKFQRFRRLPAGLTVLFDKMTESIDTVNKRVRDLKIVNQLSKGLTDNFGKFIKTADNAAVKGVFGMNQSAKAQADMLKTLIERGKAATKIDKQARAERELGLKAEKVAVGMAIGLPEIIRKQTEEETKRTRELLSQLTIQRLQNIAKKEQQELASIQVSQNIANKREGEALKKLEAQKGIQEKLLDIIKAKAQFEREILGLQDEQNQKARQLAEIQAKAAAEAGIGNMRTAISKTQSERADQEFFPGLFTRADVDTTRKDLIQKEYDLQIAVIKEKERVVRFEAEEARIDLRNRIFLLFKEREESEKVLQKTKEIQAIEKDIETKKQQAEIQKITDENARLTQQKAIVTAQANVQQAQLDAQRAAQKFENEKQLIELKNLQAQVRVVEEFQKAVGVTPFVKAIDEFVKDSQRKAGLTGKDVTGIGDLGEFEPVKIATNFEDLEQRILDNQQLQKDAYDEQTTANKELTASRLADLTSQITANNALKVNVAERQALETKLADMSRKEAIDAINREIKLIDEKIKSSYQEFQIIDAEEKAKLEGLQRERDAAAALRDEKLKQIARERDYFKQFGSDVSRIFSGELSSAFNSFFDGVREGKGVLDSAKDAFNSFMQNIINSLQKSVTEKFITPVLEDVGSGIMKSFFGAAGGPVQLAAGGAMRRDRVPAMLEPGEFVIRKPMAKAIGGPALHAMNGTGKGLAPNIEVVVNNEGTPKDAQASVKPQIDVDKLVVEIVTRDIRNNGPIRKTLRTGAN